MATDAKRGYIRIDEHIWTDSTVRKLTKQAVVAYVFLIAWSKSTRKDGRFDHLAVRLCDVSEDDLVELSAAGLIEKCADDEWTIPKFGEWQMTEADVRVKQNNSRAYGAKGGETKRDNATNAEVAKAEESAGPEVVQRLRNLHAAWMEKRPRIKGELSRESLGKVVAAYNASPVPIDEFEQKVCWRLDEFDLSSNPDKTDFLGFLSNFLKDGRWKEQLPVPTSGAPGPFNDLPYEA